MPLYTAAELKEIVGGGVHPGIPDLCDALTSSLTFTSAYNGTNPLVLGAYYIWVDGTGDLRINSGAPSAHDDGVVIGGQS